MRITLLAALLSWMFMEITAGEPEKLEPFHSVVLSGGMEVQLIRADFNGFETDFENAGIKAPMVEVEDSVLNIRRAPGNPKDSRLRVKVYYEGELKFLQARARAKLESGEDLHFEGNLKVKLNKGGEMRFGLYCSSLVADLSQGSVIHLSGKTGKAEIEVRTGATFSGYLFEVTDADVDAATGGKAKVSVKGHLEARAVAKGFVGYVGEPASIDIKSGMMGEILKTTLE